MCDLPIADQCFDIDRLETANARLPSQQALTDGIRAPAQPKVQ